MIQFYSALDFSKQPDKQSETDNKVKELQQAFGERHCPCHPQYQWAVGIEPNNEGSYEALPVVTSELPCSFLTDILSNEIAGHLRSPASR